jgi:hypothetical protein
VPEQCCCCSEGGERETQKVAGVAILWHHMPVNANCYKPSAGWSVEFDGPSYLLQVGSWWDLDEAAGLPALLAIASAHGQRPT